jgi:hypothetical protein
VSSNFTSVPTEEETQLAFQIQPPCEWGHSIEIEDSIRWAGIGGSNTGPDERYRKYLDFLADYVELSTYINHSYVINEGTHCIHNNTLSMTYISNSYISIQV